MKKINIILSIASGLIAFFILVPTLQVLASGSCSSMNCVVLDSFNFSDYLNYILIGLPTISFTDSFHLADLAPSVIVSNPICSNPFVTSTLCNPQQGTGFVNFFDTSSTVGKVVTEVGIPTGLVISSIFIPAKWGVKSFYIIFPIVNFVILALAWIGIIPSWFIIVDIIIVSAGVAYIVIMLFSGSTTSHSEGG